MTIAIFALLLILALALFAFTRANPAGIAAAIRLAGPMILGIAGLILLFAGRSGLGGTLLSGAVAWFGSNRLWQRPQKPSPGRKSSVRSAALEMELDHDTGDLTGSVLAGRHEGRRLSDMSVEELMELRNELSSDAESVQLLEAYLDSRFPAWRQGTDSKQSGGQGSAPRSGPMSKQEAYDILGLEMGASATEIRKAHRRLMQRLHPDMGGTAFLAARINEARDVLLFDHR